MVDILCWGRIGERGIQLLNIKVSLVEELLSISDGSSEFPISFSIKLVSFNENSTIIFRRIQQDQISWYSLTRVDLYYISNL